MQTHLSKKRFRACAIVKVWGYPSPDAFDEEDEVPIHWAWACRCGKHDVAYGSEDQARAAATKHFDAGQPNG